MQTYDDKTSNVATLVTSILNDQAELIDVSRDSESNRILIVILVGDDEHMLEYVE